MKKLFLLTVAVLLIATTFAQKTIRDPNVEVRNVGSFHAIEVSGGINLYLSKGDEAVAVSASDKEVLSHIKTEVKDGVLKIYYEWKKGLNWNVGNHSLKAYVSFKSLDALTASGGSDIKLEDTLKSNELYLNISGGSDFTGKVNIGKLTINQSGGSDVHMGGSATTLTIHASGGSDFSGYNMVADICSIEASGGSDIDITVNKEISAKATGASDVSWKGTATVKEMKASGAGSVSHRS